MVTRHPEMKLELEIARSARRHQREIAAAFEEARHQHYLRHHALHRDFPVRDVNPMLRRWEKVGALVLAELDVMDPLHTHSRVA